MAKKHKAIFPAKGHARVIQDSRDASKDYQLPTARAKSLYLVGKLDINQTNSVHEIVYSTNKHGKVK